MFSGNLTLTMDPGSEGKFWAVDSLLVYSTNKVSYVVCPGFKTDGASIPRLLWRVIGPPLRGRYAPAAVLHDYLYQVSTGTRKGCDKVFYQAMLDLGVKKVKAWVIYMGVRIGGWVAWNNHRRI